MAVFVLGRNKKPLMPCSEKRARLLLERGRARVHKIEPFTIRLVDRTQDDCELQPLRLKLDPGSKTTGFAVTLEQEQGVKAKLLGEIAHKQGISDALKKRKDLRKNRRNRNTPYREERNDHRTRKEGWLPPSIQARVDQTVGAAKKLKRLMPLVHVSIENVKFDMHKMQNDAISGVEYQQGTLHGYEVREYLLEKFDRRCAYCEASDVPLQIEHYIPRSKGGTDRISNLAIACEACNQAKGSLSPEEWITKLSKSKKVLDAVRLKNFVEVKKQLKASLKDAAHVNTTRKRIVEDLVSLFGVAELGTGALTKFNRSKRILPKTHYFDALCVGLSTPEYFTSMPKYSVVWKACGRGSRQMARVDKYGFPKGHRERKKTCFGFMTGDLVKANVQKGKNAGNVYKGRLMIRHTGYFAMTVGDGVKIDSIKHADCQLLQRGDGWHYTKKPI